MTPDQFWGCLMARVPREWWRDADEVISDAQLLRERADFNTGSITATAAVAIRAVSHKRAPSVAIEVGTFIGVSTRSIQAEQIYTCDVSNDCLPSAGGLTCYPYTPATQMFRELVSNEVQAQFFFFDGLLSPKDVPLIQALSSPGAVYLFDDYNERFKGVQNVEKMQPVLKGYQLIPAAGPIKDDTTLALLCPEGWA